MNILLHLWLPPERRIFYGDLYYFVAIGLLVKHNLSSRVPVALLFLSGLTNDHVILVGKLGYIRPNQYPFSLQVSSVHREGLLVNLHLRKAQSSFINGRLYMPPKNI